jgi:O-acetyl-ADP-ribose deacetylase (regulator of RNase III)
MPLPIQVWLIHPQEEACDAFRVRFAGLPGVTVTRSRFEDLPPHDCFVTAGNAFGMMTAGIDAAVVRFHGEDLMRRIQFRILDEYLGEQPIGTAMIESTGNRRYPFIAHAPTMRVPGSIEGSDKAYCAAWASFLAVYHHNVTSESKIESVVFPALGAGFGGLSYSESARQIAAAYRHYLNPPHRFTWDMVVDRQKAIANDGDRQVVKR